MEQLEDRRVLAAFTVLNTADGGAGSLRQAVVDANANLGNDTIQFGYGVSGTITLVSGELAISDPVDIHGPGASVVTVSGNNASRVFFVSANASISGLAITGGSASTGGGIYNSSSMLTVENCLLSGNSASSNGGGIFNTGTLKIVTSSVINNSGGGLPGSNGGAGGIGNTGTVTLDDSTVSGNSGSYEGGGISNGGTATVRNSTLSGNSAYLYGGGILNRGTLTVDSTTFSTNSAAFGGAILNDPDRTVTVQHSKFSGNSTSNSGGGIYNRGTFTLDSSTLSGNSGNYGGGIANAIDGTLFLQNSTLSGNSAGPFGGGVYNVGTLTANNSTISGNADWGYGGGIYSRGTSTLNNTIVAANLDSYGAAYDIDGVITSGSSHNLIGVDTNLGGIGNGTNGNLVGTASTPINPMLGALQNNGGPTATMALLPGSPAFNAGANSLIPGGVTTDQRGTGYNRIQNGTVDMGALEFLVDTDPFTFIVTNLADNGLGSLRQVISNANANPGADIIQFASGLNGTILLTSGELAITDDAVDIQGPGASIINVSGNNASRVFRVTANATISGLTISGGSSNDGGGIYNAYGTLTVWNSTLNGNSADNGGGIYNAFGALTVGSSIFGGNSAAFGGGIYNANYGTFSVVQNSTFSANSAAHGGGIYNSYGTLTVGSSTLSGNSASIGGGGIGNSYGTLAVANSVIINNSGGGLPGSNGGAGGIGNTGTVTLDDSTVSGNSGSYEGGGISNGGTATVRNSTFADNSAYLYGGGILNQGILIVDSTTFSTNTAAFGGAINNSKSGNAYATATIRSSTLSGNSSSNSGGGIYNRGTLTLESSTLNGNSGNNGGGIANASEGTLFLQSSTLSGNSAGPFGGGIYNVGALTANNSTISGNADWSYGGGIYSRGTSTLNNTILAANLDSYGTAHDIDGVISSGSSHNLIGVDTNLSGISNGINGNKVGTATTPINPMLGALQNNGGPTATMALLPGSPAINAGDNSLIPLGVTNDQRGVGYARIDSGTVDIGAFELVLNHPPTANAGGPYLVNQGANIQLNASASYDLDQTTQTLVFLWDLDDDGVFGETGASGTFGDEIGINPTFSAATLVGASSHAIHLRVIDNALASSEAATTVMVRGAPVISAIGPQNCSETALIIPITAHDPEGGLLTYSVFFVSKTGAGAAIAPTDYSIDSSGRFHWTPGGGQLGQYTFQVNIVDSDGLMTQATFVATTLGVVDGVLVIVGTDGAGKIAVKPTDGDADDLTVKVNEKDYHFKLKPQNNPANPYSGVTLIHVCGLAGDDQVNIDNEITISTWLEGGAGNDQLHGGAGDDVILGGSGNDEIFGNDGNDFLIGGLGADKIKGDKGHDILVSGDIAGSLDFATLRAISQAWADSHSVAEAELIDAALDETDDATGDQLTGGAGADLFIVNAGDTISDFRFGKPKDNKEADVVVKGGVITI